MLPFQEELKFDQTFYLKTNMQKWGYMSPSPQPSQTCDLAILLVCRRLYQIGTDFTYGSNTFVFTFQAQVLYQLNYQRRGWITRVKNGEARPVSRFDRFPNAAVQSLQRVRIEIKEDLRQGTHELRDCFNNFVRAIRESQALKRLSIHVEHIYDFRGWGINVNVPLDLKDGGFDQARVHYILAPLLEFQGLGAVSIAGDVDDRFAAELAHFMMGSERRVARTRFKLTIQNLDWMQSGAIAGTNKWACYQS